MPFSSRPSPVRIAPWLLLCALLAAPAIAQSHRPVSPDDQAAPNHRTRLFLKDGTYQVVMRYTVQGKIVRFVSAERGGAIEEIPTNLVDLEATRRYEQAHAAPGTPQSPGRAPVLDPELAKEEADRAALTPEVAPDLRLDTEDSVLLLDTFQGAPELVPLTQTGGDLNQNTAHNVLRSTLNPMASQHRLIEIRGQRAPVQAHVSAPVLYLRIGDDVGAPTGSAPLVVNTHSSQGNAPVVSSGGAPSSRYVVVRADVRQDVRIVTSFRISALGSVHRESDLVETSTELLPGGHWMRVTPTQPLDFGEYALMEVLSDRDVNLGVWDFGVHPTAPDNRDALHPDPRGPATLERHPRE